MATSERLCNFVHSICSMAVLMRCTNKPRQANLLPKAKSKYQRFIDWSSVVDLEYSTGKQSYCIKPEQKMADCSLLHGRDVMALNFVNSF